MHHLELQISNNHADIVSSELEIGEVTDFGGVLLVAVVLLPPRFALVDQRTGGRVPIFVLRDEAADLSRGHDVPASVRADHDEAVGFLQLQILNFRLGDQPYPFGLEVPERASDGDSGSLLVGPNPRRTHLLSLVRQPVNLASRLLYPFSLVRPNRLMVVGKFNGQLLLGRVPEQNGPRVSQVRNEASVALEQDGDRAGSGARVVDAAAF